MPTSRIQFTSRPSSESFGLFAVIESKRVVLPLKGVECDFSVVSGIAEVSMTQVFRQDNDKPLDCAYLFPLPADGAVAGYEFRIGERRVIGQVDRSEAARARYEKALVEGFGGRPHWGQTNFLTGSHAMLETLYGKQNVSDWLDVFQTFNPGGEFYSRFTDRVGFSSHVRAAGAAV